MKYCHFIVLIALHSLATRIEAFSVLPRTAHCSFRTFSASSFVKSESSFIDIQITSFSSLYQGNDDDDGWGTEATNAESSTTSQERELATLRSEMASKRQEINAPDNSETERDLFIPIFAVVSLAGLFGAYGYEILRLQSRGELYLPWNN